MMRTAFKVSFRIVFPGDYNGHQMVCLDVARKRRLDAVSYTHLDVYKRQAQGLARGKQADLGDIVGDGSLTETRIEVEQRLRSGRGAMKALDNLLRQQHLDLTRIASTRGIVPEDFDGLSRAK